MAKRTLVFTPAAYNLAETSRMVEIAKGILDNPQAHSAFDFHFISEGGDFERLITDNGFELTRIGTPLTPEKINHIAAVNDEEKFAVRLEVVFLYAASMKVTIISGGRAPPARKTLTPGGGSR